MLDKIRSGECALIIENGKELVCDLDFGLLPLLKLYRAGRKFEGATAYDKVVGKAAACFHLHFGVREIHALIVSKSARKLLEAHGVTVHGDCDVEHIINRSGDGLCPMELACERSDDYEENCLIIAKKIEEMRNAR